MDKKAFIGLVALLILFVFYFVSLFGLKWLSFESHHMGLWYECTPEDGCKVMEYTPSYFVPFLDWYSAVRAFILLAIIFDFLAMIASILNINLPRSFKVRPIRVCVIFNVIVLIFAVVVFGVEKRNIFDNEWSLDWTYYFTCANLILTLIVAVYYIYVVKDRNLQKVRVTNQYARNEPLRNNDAIAQPLRNYDTNPVEMSNMKASNNTEAHKEREDRSEKSSVKEIGMKNNDVVEYSDDESDGSYFSESSIASTVRGETDTFV